MKVRLPTELVKGRIGREEGREKNKTKEGEGEEGKGKRRMV